MKNQVREKKTLLALLPPGTKNPTKKPKNKNTSYNTTA